MNGTLTGMPGIDDLIRQILGEDDQGDSPDDGEWAGVTELMEIYPTRLDAVFGPASGLPPLMAKSARQRAVTRLVKTVSQAQRITMHIAYPVDKVDVSRAADNAQDFVKASALEAGAWAFMKSGAQIGTDHRDGTTGAGTCLESWIHRAPPWTMTAVDGSQQTVHTGDWCVLIQWSPSAWARFQKGDLNGVSMQGSAKRRRPPASALAGVRKSARKPPRCGKCSKRARTADDRFCRKCGARLAKAPVAKSAAVLRAEAERADLAKAAAGEALAVADRAAWELGRWRQGDHSALGRLEAEVGQDAMVELLSGQAAPEDAALLVAKARLTGSGDLGGALTGKCRTCGGRGRLKHPATGKASRNCPSCRGSGKWTPGGDQADMTEEDAGLVTQYTQQARSGGPEAADGMSKLSAIVGMETAAKLVSGQPVSPGEFRRGYLAAGRAGLSAAPDQSPRIPDATHVAEASDFRRPLLTVRQARPAPGSVWPGQGGQQDYYGGSAGVDTNQVPWNARTPASTWPTPGLASSSRMPA